MKDRNKKAVLVVVVMLAAFIVLTMVMLTATQIKKGGESTHYDFDCLTRPGKNPLNECKEEP